jgi:membrane associated rhomboid family serine protease
MWAVGRQRHVSPAESYPERALMLLSVVPTTSRSKKNTARLKGEGDMQGMQSRPRMSPVTLAICVLIVCTCIAQSWVGWQALSVAFGFIPSAVWSPSNWFATQSGQAVPVVATWLAYLFPHTSWMHMAGNVFGIALFGWGVEREMGSRKYAGAMLLSVVFGAFALAAVHPRGASPISGGSLLGFSLIGMWLAIYYKASWKQHLRVTMTLEALVTAAILLWLLFRQIPTQPSLLLGIMWHVVPLVAGWIALRIAITLEGAGSSEGGNAVAQQTHAASWDT